MADNYLEKKFEEYAIRKSTAKTKKIVSTGPKPEHIEVRFPTRRVFVTGGANGIGKAIVQAFRKIGCRVAFCDNDRKNGSLTAQTSGARFYPVDVCDSKALQSCMHDIFTTWGDIDIQKHRSTTSTVSSPPTYDRYSSRPEKWPCTDNLYPDPIITGASSILPLPATL